MATGEHVFLVKTSWRILKIVFSNKEFTLINFLEIYHLPAYTTYVLINKENNYNTNKGLR